MKRDHGVRASTPSSRPRAIHLKGAIWASSALLLSTLPAAADSVAPTLLLLTPARGGVVTGVDTVKVQYWDADGPAATAPLEWRVDGTGLWNALGAADINGNYSCGSNCAVYEFDLDTTGGGLDLANGSHTLNLRATDAATTPNTGTLNWPFTVNNPDVNQSGGSGMLLRRSSGSQLCIDCHNFPAHSSQTTDTGYGNWAVGCLDCHQPHGGTNIFLIREQIETPNSGLRDVRFEDNTIGAQDDSSTPGTASFANEDNVTGETDGPCQVCHTQTGGATARWRNSASGGNVQSHYTTLAGTQPCTNCHPHAKGFKGEGACLDCHGTDTQGSRRAVLADFDNQTGGGDPRSHHVGNTGTTMGGSLTSFDCVVCHAEGRVDTSGAQPEVATVPTYHGNDGGSTSIDLKDADDWDDATGTGTVYAFDKDDIAANTPGGAVDWNSGNQYWREWTSGVDETGGADLTGVTAGLDPFCLSCHDGGASAGATASANATDTECGGSADALNPFCDGAITNEYDQQDRGAVVDIESKVSGSPPSDGQFSRHAIRGQSTSVFTIYRNLPSVCGDNTPPDEACTSIWEATMTVNSVDEPFLVTRVCQGGTNAGGVCDGAADCPGGTCVGPTDEAGDPLWNDSSVMGCADCHTVDGANGANGNAHGAPSEYLLKDNDDSDGVSEGNLVARTYVCYRCHNAAVYQPPRDSDHTGNEGDWVDTTAAVGLSGRVGTPPNFPDATEGSIFGIACANCHGGTDWGRIHGTSETLPIEDAAGTGGTRNAYRFTNGSSLRYFDPEDGNDNSWVASKMSCYTLGAADNWGSCTHHGGGRSHDRNVLRPISY